MSIQKAEMTVERIENGQYVEQVAYPYVEYDHVAMENGMDIMSMIRDDVSTPMVTHNTTSWKVGQGDSDVSESIVDSSIGVMTIKGQTIEGKSAFDGVDKVEIVSQNTDNGLSNITSFQLAHPLRSLPNRVQDEIVLDRVNHKAKIIQRVGEDLTQLETPIITEVNLEGYPYVCKGGHIFLNTEIAPITEMTYSINQAHQIESSNEDILRHQKEINHLYELITQYVQVQYEAELIDIALQG